MPAACPSARGRQLKELKPDPLLGLSAWPSDQTVGTPDAPGSIEPIARAADEARFQKRDALLPLWERHVLPGKLSGVVVRRALRVGE